MKNKEIPIAIPVIIPAIKPISKSELSVESDNCSFSEVIDGRSFDSVKLTGFSKFTTVDSDGRIISELEIISDERFVNFVFSVIGSVVEFPPNNVECVNSE